MGGIFSGCQTEQEVQTSAPRGTVSAVDKAVLDLKNARDKLSRYRRQLDKDSQKLLQRAKECNTNGNKNMAIGLLRLRKLKENECRTVENQLLNVLEMVDTIAGKEKEIDLVKAMKAGKEALEKLHKEISVDEVLQLMDKVEEEAEVERQINEAIADGVVSLSDVDENAVEEELRELEKSMEEDKQIEQPTVPTMPNVPDKPLPEVSAAAEESKPERVLVPS